MRRIKTIKIPEHERKVQDGLVCDLCGTESKSPDEWSDKNYNVAETEIRMRFGDVFPEGDFSKTTEFDICPDCFEDKLIPWMKLQGAVPTERDTE
jgi:hypothetical protein